MSDPRRDLSPALEELVRDLQPVRAARPAWEPALAWLLAATPVLAVILRACLSLRADLDARIVQPGFWAELGAELLAAGLAAWAVQTLGLPGRSTLRRQQALALALPASLALIYAVRTFNQALQDPATVHCQWSETRCTTTLLGLSVAPAILFFARARRYASTSPAWSGALIGIASATLAGAALALHCPSDAPLHLLLWHLGLPLVLAAILGGWAGRRWLRW